MDFRNEYIDDLDLLFIKHCIEQPYLIAETKISSEMINDVLAKILHQIILKSIANKNSFIPDVDLEPLIQDKDRVEKYNRFEHPIKLTSTTELITKFREMSSDKKFGDIESTIIERFNRKQLKKIGGALLSEVEDSSKTSKDLLREYGYRIDMLLNKASDTRTVVTSSDLLRNEIAYIEKTVEDAHPTTGCIIDLVNEGVGAPSLIFFVAEPKNNKSTSLYNSCMHSLKLGRTCVFATMEISAEETSRKLLSIYSGVPFQAIDKRRMTDEQKEMYITKLKEFEELTKDKLFIIDDQNGMSSKDILAYCNHLERAGINIDDVFIDYLMLLTPNDPRLSRVEAFSVASQDLRKMSQQLNARVFSAQQLSGAAHSKDFEELSYDDVYYCKTLSQDCTYTVANRHIKMPDGSSRLMQKFFPSRQVWDERVYYYPDYDPACFDLGEPDVLDDDDVFTSSTNKSNKKRQQKPKEYSDRELAGIIESLDIGDINLDF